MINNKLKIEWQTQPPSFGIIFLGRYFKAFIKDQVKKLFMFTSRVLNMELNEQ